MELDDYMQGRLIEAHERAVARMASPWLDRKLAGYYAQCSPSEIDRAADAGVFKRYRRAGTPMFRKDEIDEALVKGTWGVRKAESGKRKAEIQLEAVAA